MTPDLNGFDPEKLEFMEATRLLGSRTVFFASLKKHGLDDDLWLVWDRENPTDVSNIRSTDYMKAMYRSKKNQDGKPVMAAPGIQYLYLVHAGFIKMGLKDGCPGCKRLWSDRGSEGQCSKCKRCLSCCCRESVENSCENKAIMGKFKRVKYRRRG